MFEPDGASGVKCVGCSGRQLSCAREMSLVVSPMSCSLSPADSWCDVHEIASHPITPAFGVMFSIVFGEGVFCVLIKRCHAYDGIKHVGWKDIILIFLV